MKKCNPKKKGRRKKSLQTEYKMISVVGCAVPDVCILLTPAIVFILVLFVYIRLCGDAHYNTDDSVFSL